MTTATASPTPGLTRNAQGFSIELNPWIKTKGKPGKMTEKNGNEVNVNNGHVQIVVNHLPNGKFIVPTISHEKEFDAESILVVSVKEKEQVFNGWKSYPDLKVWDDESISKLSVPSDNKKGMYSRVDETVSQEFHKSVNKNNGLIRMYYKKKLVHGQIEVEPGVHEEREIMFYVHIKPREKTKKDTSNSSPYQWTYAIGWFQKKNRTDPVSFESSIFNDALQKIKENKDTKTDYKTFYFSGQENTPCFSSQHDCIDVSSDFYVRVGENFHPLKYVIPWPFVRGFKPNSNKKSFVIFDDPQTEEDFFLTSLVENKRKKTKQANGSKKKSTGEDGAPKKRKSNKPKDETEADDGAKLEKKDPNTTESKDTKKKKSKSSSSPTESKEEEDESESSSSEEDEDDTKIQPADD